MEQHFELFRDPVSTIRHSYTGAFNNRIDRFPATGNAFRVEGVTDHVLKTNSFISEDMQFTRRLQLPSEIEYDPNDGSSFCRNAYTFFNRCLFAPPDYPRGFPGISDRCVEPHYMDDTQEARFTRFPLNKTFDNVRWRTENSKNSHRCNIYDTVELVPWLTSEQCRQDIERDPTSDFKDLVWYDFNTNREFTTTPTIPDCTIPLSRKRRIGFTQNAVGGGPGGPFTLQEIDEGAGNGNPEIDRGLLFHHDTAGIINSITLQYDTEEKIYTHGTIRIQTTADLDPFTGITDAHDFWLGASVLTNILANGTYTNLNAINGQNLFILAGAVSTSPLQPDGYCYYGEIQRFAEFPDATPPINNADRFLKRPYINLHVQDNLDPTVFFITNIVLFIPSFRIPLGSTRQDFQLCNEENLWHGHLYHNFVQPFDTLRVDLRTGNNIVGRARGDLYESNIPLHEKHLDHHGSFESHDGLLKPVKFARFFYDTPDMAGDWDNISDGFGNVPVQEHYWLTPWCIEFDLTTDMGAYLWRYWSEQSKKNRGNRTNNEYWRNTGEPLPKHFQCLARTSYQADDGNIEIYDDLINSYTKFLIQPFLMLKPNQITVVPAAGGVPAVRFPFQNVNDDVERGRLYFLKQWDPAANVFPTRNAVLWNANNDADTTTFFNDDTTAITPGVFASTFLQWDEFEGHIYVPTIGNYGAHYVYPRLLAQDHFNRKALFEQYNGTGNQSIDLFTLQPDPTQMVLPIIPIGVRLNLQEPFFTVGSAKQMFPCIRPFDIKGDDFPLVIQDYRINFRRRYDRGFTTRTPFGTSTVNYFFDWEIFFNTSYFDQGIEVEPFLDLASDVITTKMEARNLQLITTSQDSADQKEKSVSAIEKYVPKLDVYASLFVDPVDATLTQKIFCNNGFPSYMFLRMEWDSREMTEEFRDFELGSDPVKRLPIQSIVIKLFGHENPYVSKLLEKDLYYICRKNCHKYCNFKKLWADENALLLTLEDIGLTGEATGYPNKKRLEFEIRVTWKTPDSIVSLETAFVNAGRRVQLRSVFINENHYLRGDSSRIEFYEVF